MEEKVKLQLQAPAPISEEKKFMGHFETEMFDRAMHVVYHSNPNKPLEQKRRDVCVLWLMYFRIFTTEQTRWRQGSHVLDLFNNGTTAFFCKKRIFDAHVPLSATKFFLENKELLEILPKLGPLRRTKKTGY